MMMFQEKNGLKFPKTFLLLALLGEQAYIYYHVSQFMESVAPEGDPLIVDQLDMCATSQFNRQPVS